MKRRFNDFRAVIWLLCFFEIRAVKINNKGVQDGHVKLIPSLRNPLHRVVQIYASNYQQVILLCKIENIAVEPSCISWTRDKKEIIQGPPYVIPWKNNGKVLMVRPVIKNVTDGLYECHVNCGDNIADRGVNIVVTKNLPIGFPKIVTHPTNINKPRPSVDFHCSVISQGVVELLWFHNRIPITIDANKEVITQLSEKRNAQSVYTSNLALKNISAKDNGFYHCIAFNKFGQAVSNQAHLGIMERKKFRKRIRKSSSSIVSRCEGLSNDLNAYPTQISLNAITCQHSWRNGHYILIQWDHPLITNSSVKVIQIIMTENQASTYCFQLGNETTEFRFTRKLGFRSKSTYSLSIVPLPTRVSDYSVTDLPECPAPTTTTVSIMGNSILHSTKPPGSIGLGKIIAIALGVIGGIISVVVIAILRLRCAKKPLAMPPPVGGERVVYISHCAVSDREIAKVMSLASHLNSIRGLKVCLDLCSQTNINEMGGFSSWLPKELNRANKILMVITPAYIQALREKCTDSSCKVSMETVYVRQLLYINRQRSRNVTVVIDDISKNELPTDFQGRSLVKFPKHFNEKDSNWRTLAALLLDVEPIQMRSNVS